MSIVNHFSLETGVRQVKNVGRFNIGAGSFDDLPRCISVRRACAHRMGDPNDIVFLVDEYFVDRPNILERLSVEPGDRVVFVPTSEEPKTDDINDLVASLISDGFLRPAAIIGVGGGITLDTAKATSNLLTNGGKAEDYQGWDLVKVPGIYKIAVPTISGTGAEATRTCVMTRSSSGLKLGMNSDHTVFDHLILDPDLSISVPRDQYFYTGMDTYIHCMESMAGSYRNAIGDAYSREASDLCRQVFLAEEMMAFASREKLMVASYLGGCAIATSYVGVAHPLSAGLSVVLGLHHGIANCIVMRAMSEFYPASYEEFWSMVTRQQVTIPQGVARDLHDDEYRALYDAMIVHEKPLTNALGRHYRDILTLEKVTSLYQAM